MRNIYFILSVFFITYLTGCAPVLKSFPGNGYGNIPKSMPEDVEVYKGGSKPSTEYYSIGTIYVEKIANTTPTDLFEEDVEPLVKKASSNMGADAVIGTHFTHYFDLPPSDFPFGGEYRMRASGIAVKYGEHKKDVNEKHIDFLKLGMPQAADRNAEILMKADNNMRLSIQYFLEKNGYYVNLSDASVDYSVVDNIDDRLENIISASNDELPVVMFSWISSYKPDEDAAKEKSKLNLMLYSKIKNEIIFENSVDIKSHGLSSAVGLTLIAGPIGLLAGLAADAIEYDSTVFKTTVKSLIQPLITSNVKNSP